MSSEPDNRSGGLGKWRQRHRYPSYPGPERQVEVKRSGAEDGGRGQLRRRAKQSKSQSFMGGMAIATSGIASIKKDFKQASSLILMLTSAALSMAAKNGVVGEVSASAVLSAVVECVTSSFSSVVARNLLIPIHMEYSRLPFQLVGRIRSSEVRK